MKLPGKTLLQLDRCFWLPHRLAEWLRKTLGGIRKDPTHHVLVVKFMGLGSLVHFALLCERNQVDKTKIAILTLSQHRELLALLGFENALFIRTNNVLNFLQDCWKTISKARRLNPSTIIDFERCSHSASLFANVLALFARCPTISFENGRSIASSKQIVFDVNKLTQEQLFLNGIRSMAMTGTVRDNDELVQVESSKVIININASNYFLARRYPISSFVDLIRLLHQWNPDLEFFLTGTAEESEYTATLANKLPGVPIQNVAGAWNLDRLVKELSNCAVFITGDSGPLHLAAFMQIPMIAIWGPTQPEHFGYESLPAIVNSTLNLSCSPCLRHPASNPAKHCHGTINCLKNLPPSAIFQMAVSILTKHATTRNVHPLSGRSISAQRYFHQPA